jgi:tryptophan 2,3-dioxygenase
MTMGHGEAPAANEVQQLLSRVAQFAAVKHTEQAEAADTRARLNAHGLDNAEIERQLESLKWNTAENKTAAITTYSYLHGLQHLDAINAQCVTMTGPAAAIVALYQSAEICLGAIGTLSSRMLSDLQEGRIGPAFCKAQWRSGFQRLLYKLGLLLVEMNGSGEDGAFLRIAESRIYGNYREQNRLLQQWLMESWKEADGDVFGKGLDDPKRNIFFNEFVNTGEERVWASLFAQVQVPGVNRNPEEDDAAFYARVAGSEQIERMLRAMETETDTDLLPFRVVHQVTEVVAGVANTLACEAATRLLTAAADRPLDPALRAITLTNRLLTAADESIKLMQRALTPNAYSSVRPNLGMVRGTSSMVLRKTLFNSTYPLLVRAFKLRLMEFSGEQAGNEDGVYERAREILRDVEGHNALRGLLQQLVIFHQHVRTWRDNHIQLPKTHLGVSDPADPPTVSLSGSDGAVDIAHELRKTHEADPIVPLYRALLGTAPPAVHEVLAPGEFDDYMARATAREVFDVYSEVQERFYRRCPMRHAAGT